MFKFNRRIIWKQSLSLVDPAVGVSILAATILVSIGGWQIVQARDQALGEADVGIATMSRALAQHAGRTVEAVDLSLVEAVDHVEGGMDAGALRNSLLRRKSLLSQVRDIAIVRPDGSRVADALHADTDEAGR